MGIYEVLFALAVFTLVIAGCRFIGQMVQFLHAKVHDGSWDPFAMAMAAVYIALYIYVGIGA